MLSPHTPIFSHVPPLNRESIFRLQIENLKTNFIEEKGTMQKELDHVNGQVQMLLAQIEVRHRTARLGIRFFQFSPPPAPSLSGHNDIHDPHRIAT